MQYQGYGGNVVSTAIFAYFWFWFIFVGILCVIFVCLRVMCNYMVRVAAPSRNPGFATAAPSRPLNSAASTSGIPANANASTPLNSATTPRATVVQAPASASTTSSYDHSAVPNVLQMLPDFVYSAGAQKENLNCCVCQMDFKDGEKGRFLPGCFHCFHVECIDMWLASHSQCPVCRTSIN